MSVFARFLVIVIVIIVHIPLIFIVKMIIVCFRANVLAGTVCVLKNYIDMKWKHNKFKYNQFKFRGEETWIGHCSAPKGHRGLVKMDRLLN